jgi:hypothetical protein
MDFIVARNTQDYPRGALAAVFGYSSFQPLATQKNYCSLLNTLSKITQYDE